MENDAKASACIENQAVNWPMLQKSRVYDLFYGLARLLDLPLHDQDPSTQFIGKKLDQIRRKVESLLGMEPLQSQQCAGFTFRQDASGVWITSWYCQPQTQQPLIELATGPLLIAYTNQTPDIIIERRDDPRGLKVKIPFSNFGDDQEKNLRITAEAVIELMSQEN